MVDLGRVRRTVAGYDEELAKLDAQLELVYGLVDQLEREHSGLEQAKSAMLGHPQVVGALAAEAAESEGARL